MKEAAALPDDVAIALGEIEAASGGCGCGAGLLRFMSEDAPIYQHKGSSEVERLRAFIAVKLANAGLADALMPFALEEIETGTNAYAIASAARVVRAASTMPPGITELMVAAIDRIRPVNEFVQFDDYPGLPGPNSMTAVDEAIQALSIARAKVQAATDAMGRQAYGNDNFARQPPIVGSIASLRDIELQNQDGKCARFGDIFAGRPGIVAFFYTRCMNPNKCSRTISQLAEMQRVIRERAIGNPAMIAGITYDPEYDLPERLHRYGTDRRLAFDENCQLLRSTGSFDAIRDGLQLGVGYGSSTVNRHRIEVLVIDRAGAIVHSNVRRLWDVKELTDLLLDV